jgi:hypothetical protein
MPSLGEGEISIANQRHGIVRVRSLYPIQALYPCLGIEIGIELHELPENISQQKPPLIGYELRDLSGELRMGEHDNLLGFVGWAGERTHVRSHALPNQRNIRLALDLDPVRLELAERTRNGRAPRFWLDLWPTVIHHTEFLDAECTRIQFSVPIETWVQVISTMQRGSYEIIEVRFDVPRAERFQKAVGHLRDARRKIDEGMFDEAAALSRKAIEATATACGLPKNADWATLFKKSRQERCATEFGGIASRLKQLAGFAIHDMNQPAPDYTRSEAQFIVRTSEAFLALAAGLVHSPDR